MKTYTIIANGIKRTYGTDESFASAIEALYDFNVEFVANLYDGDDHYKMSSKTNTWELQEF